MTVSEDHPSRCDGPPREHSRAALENVGPQGSGALQAVSNVSIDICQKATQRGDHRAPQRRR